MSFPTWRRLLPTLLVVVAFLATFAITALLRLQPWRKTVVLNYDPEATLADAAALSSAWQGVSPAHGQGPNLIFIVLDTVRADHLELYGHAWSTMPNLTRRAATGQVFTQAQSPSPWTLPAHASMFTGLLPLEHGTHGVPLSARETANQRTLKRARHRVRESPLANENTTLAEALKTAGYRTLGISANQAFLQPYWNLNQGFDLWLCEQLSAGADGLPYLRADRITDLALAAADLHLAAGAPPLLLFLNFMDAHGPYVPREGYVRDERMLSMRFRQGAGRTRLANEVLLQTRSLPEDIHAAWTEAYDAELRFLDQELERLLAGLEARGLLEGAYVVVTSDHGEYFGEHDLLAHSKDVFQPVLHVPLLRWGPGLTALKQTEPTSTSAIYGWMLSWAGLAAAPVSAAEFVVSELYGSRMPDYRKPRLLQRFNRVRRAFISGTHKIILGSDGSFEAYDLATDGDELLDRRDQAWAVEQRRSAETWLAQHTPPEASKNEGSQFSAGSTSATLDEEVNARLQALGYQD